MHRADAKLASAILRLDGDPNFNTVRAWLKDSYMDQLEENIDLRNSESTRGQGYAEALRDINKIIDDPRKLAEKFKQ